MFVAISSACPLSVSLAPILLGNMLTCAIIGWQTRSIHEVSIPTSSRLHRQRSTAAAVRDLTLARYVALFNVPPSVGMIASHGHIKRCDQKFKNVMIFWEGPKSPRHLSSEGPYHRITARPEKQKRPNGTVAANVCEGLGARVNEVQGVAGLTGS